MAWASRLSMIFMILAMNFICPNVRAWGNEGHEAVAKIAYAHLQPSARVALDKILAASGFTGIEDASTWPDRDREMLPGTGSWHYVGSHDRNLGSSHSHCGLRYPEDCEDGSCAITVIANATQSVWRARVHGATDQQSVGWALAFLVHLVGDLAQPLHATGYARGGNNVPVLFDGTSTNLHTVWDSSLIIKTISKVHLGSFAAWINAMLMTAGRSSRLARQDGWDRQKENPEISIPGIACAMTLDPDDISSSLRCAIEWAKASNTLVCDSVFAHGFQPNMETATHYWERVRQVVDTQITIGGLRLAVLLNNILGTKNPHWRGP